MNSPPLPVANLFLRTYAASATSGRGDISVLKDSIRKNGLRRSLIVTEIPRVQGRYEVVDGGRRVIAIKELISEGYETLNEVPCEIRTYADRALMVIDRVLLNLHRAWELDDRADLATFARTNGLSERGLAMLTGIPTENWSRESFDLSPAVQPERLKELANFVRDHGQSILNSTGLVTILTVAGEYAEGAIDRDKALARMLTAKLPSQVSMKNVEQLYEAKLADANRGREIAEQNAAQAQARVTLLEGDIVALRERRAS